MNSINDKRGGSMIKFGKQILQIVIKMCMLNKINDALIVDTFENVFQ